MTTMMIPANEHGVVRLFALDLPRAEAERFAAGAPETVARALGTGPLGAADVSVIDTADLAGVGLAGYLASGLGVDEADLAGDRARLDALTGHIVTLRSGAFGGEAQRVEVAAPLRWIGTYGEAAPETPEIVLESRSAEGQAPADAPEAPVRSASGRGIWVIVALVGIAALILWAFT